MIHTTIMPLVLVTHVAAVIVAITDPGRGDAPAVVAAELIRVAGSDQSGCGDTLCDIRLWLISGFF